MKKILVIIIILINLSACSRKQEIIDLEKMPNDYSPSSFYRDKIKKTNTVLATDVNKVKQDKRTELLNDNLFIKDILTQKKDFRQNNIYRQLMIGCQERKHQLKFLAIDI